MWILCLDTSADTASVALVSPEAAIFEQSRRLPQNHDTVLFGLMEEVFRSADTASVALVSPEAAIFEQSRRLPQNHDTVLFGLMEEVFRQADRPHPDPLSRGLIAVTKGPGAFTGLRIGLAASAGLSEAWGWPAVGLSTLSCLAAAAWEALEAAGDFPAAFLHATRTAPPQIPFLGDTAPASAFLILTHLHTRRQETYVQLWDEGLRPLMPAAALQHGDLAGRLKAACGHRPLFLAGDDERLEGAIGAALPQARILFHRGPRARDVGRIAAALQQKEKNNLAAYAAEALYLEPAALI